MHRSHRAEFLRITILFFLVAAIAATGNAERSLAFLKSTTYGFADVMTSASGVLVGGAQTVASDTSHAAEDSLGFLRNTTYGFADVMTSATGILANGTRTVVFDTAHTAGNGLSNIGNLHTSFNRKFALLGDAWMTTSMDAFEVFSKGFDVPLDAFHSVAASSGATGYELGNVIGRGLIAWSEVPGNVRHLAISIGEFERTEKVVEASEIAEPRIEPSLYVASVFDGWERFVQIVKDFFATRQDIVIFDFDTEAQDGDVVIVEEPTAPAAPLPSPAPISPITPFPPIFVSEEGDSIRNVYNQTINKTVYETVRETVYINNPVSTPTNTSGITLTTLAIGLDGLRNELMPLIDLAMTRPRSGSRSSGGGGGDVNSGDLDAYLQLAGGTLTGGLSGTTVTLTDYLSAPSLIITGSTTFNGTEYLFPSADGATGEVLTTNGAGVLSWGAAGSADALTLAAWYATTTDALDEGLANLYYTDERVGDYITASTTINESINYWTLSGSDVYRASGNVGIGTTTPETLLSISGSAPAITLTDTTPGGRNVLVRNGVASTGLFDIYDQTAGVSRLSIDADGNVGIGTTTPSAQLAVEGDDASEAGLIVRGASSQTAPFFSLQHSSGVDALRVTPLSFDGATLVLRRDNLDRASFYTDGSGGGMLFISSANVNLMTNSISRLLVDSTGNVGIGDEGPSAHLEVSASGGTGGNIFLLSSDDNADGDIFTVTEAGLVGIGTTSPTARLAVKGAAGSANIFEISSSTDANLLTVTAAGNVGIDTTDPLAKLQIGNSTLNGTMRSSVAVLSGDSGGASVLDALNLVNSRPLAEGNGTALNFNNADIYSPTGRIESVQEVAGPDASLRFYTYGTGLTEKMRITSVGNVGIGTTTPGHTLTVAGDALITGALYDGTYSAGTDGMVLQSTGTGLTWVATSSLGFSTDHGELDGLADDDHTQYALLAGRSGGQTLIGGTASGNTLTLQSTSHATKGKLLFGTSAYDEVNNRLGIGTDAPSTHLDLGGTLRFTAGASPIINATSDLYFQNSSVQNYRLSSSTGAGLQIKGGLPLSWTNGGIAGNDSDTFIHRDAANTVALRNGANAQALNIYNTYTNSSNYERLSTSFSSNIITFASQAAGTGTARDFNFSGGNVGIGIADPTGKLEVYDGDVRISNQGVNPATLYLWGDRENSGDVGGVDGVLAFRTDNNEGFGWNVEALNYSGYSDLAFRHRYDGVNYEALYLQGIDGGGGRVGIGTTTPSALLTVGGQALADYFTAASTTATSIFAGGLSAGTTGLNVLSNGYVGVGTTPFDQTHFSVLRQDTASAVVGASIRTTGDASGGMVLVIGNNTADPLPYRGLRFQVKDSGLVHLSNYSGGAYQDIVLAQGGGQVRIGGAGAANAATNLLDVAGEMAIGSTYVNSAAPTNGLIVEGNVGIGTITPTAKLDVGGAIRATGQSSITSGAGLELQYAGGVGRIYSYDRSAGQYKTLVLNDLIYVDTATGKTAIGNTSALQKLGIYENVNLASGPTYNLSLEDRTAMAEGVGGAIGFSGNYISDVTGGTLYGLIRGAKSNGVSGDYGGDLAFYSRPNGSVITEGMRLTGTGRVGIGTTTPATMLVVNGTSTLPVILGGSSSDGNLTLQSTSHALKGRILFGESGAYDERYHLFGVGTRSPLPVAPDSSGVHVVSEGDTYPFYSVERTNGSTFTNRRWSTGVDAGGEYFISDTTGGGLALRILGDGTSNFAIQRGAVVNEEGGDYDFRVESDTNANAFFVDGATGNVGLGTSTPQIQIHVVNESGTALMGTQSTGAAASLIVERTDGAWGRLQAGAGANFYFQNGKDFRIVEAASDDTAYDASFGVDGGGHFQVFTGGNTAVGGAGFSGGSTGNLALGGSTFAASAEHVLHLFNGVAPTGSITDGIVLYSEDVTASAELKVRDEAGNITTLSPHNFSLIEDGPSEPLAWSFYSERDNRKLNVDMLRTIRLVEGLAGERLVYGDLKAYKGEGVIHEINERLNIIEDELVIGAGNLTEQLAAIGLNIKDGVLTVVRIVTDKLTTKELCLEDVCITKTELELLLDNAQVESSGNGADEPVVADEPAVVEEPAPIIEDVPPADEPVVAGETPAALPEEEIIEPTDEVIPPAEEAPEDEVIVEPAPPEEEPQEPADETEQETPPEAPVEEPVVEEEVVEEPAPDSL